MSKTKQKPQVRGGYALREREAVEMKPQMWGTGSGCKLLEDGKGEVES